MNISQRTSHTQMYRLMVYNRALHPELFDLQSRRLHQQGAYDAEIWISPSGHAVRFQVDDLCITEAMLENTDHLPETGLIHALPCLGEKEFELSPDGNIGYVTTIQTESLTDNLYMTTYREVLDFSKETQPLQHQWVDPDGTPCLSLIEIQKYKREFHVQSFHLLGSLGLVLRTQAIFERLD